jgi:hypothetical protein
MTGCYAVCASRGAVAQLVARLVRIEKVAGSIPAGSTTFCQLKGLDSHPGNLAP